MNKGHTNIKDKAEFFRELAGLLKKAVSIVWADDPETVQGFRKKHPSHPFWMRWDEVTAAITSADEQQEFNRYCSAFITNGPIPVVAPDTDDGAMGLVEKGLAVIVGKRGSDDDDDESYMRIMLSPDVCRKLFRGLYTPPFAGAVSSTACVIRPETIPVKRLYYDNNVARQLEDLRKLADVENYRRIAERFAAKGRRAGAACLLYGPPGSGKTELVLQVARESGRAVVAADAAKVTGRYMGETEKAIRGLFRVYRYVTAVSENAPILLMNEADGLLWKRDEAPDSSAGRAFNIAQALFLDEMDTFEGILVATTNLPQAFDAAIFRRFLLKIHVGVPNIATRQRIWRDILPLLDEGQAYTLAKRFPFTGGFIANVADRCDLREVLDGKQVTFDEVMAFAELERGGEPGTGAVMPVAVGNKNAS